MKQIFENIASFKSKISNLLHYEVSKSHTKIEYHFHGPVNFVSMPSKTPNHKINSLTSKVKPISKF